MRSKGLERLQSATTTRSLPGAKALGGVYGYVVQFALELSSARRLSRPFLEKRRRRG